jgi:hypothetical protein
MDAMECSRIRAASIVKRFTVVMDCTWKGNEGVLDEAFTYSDGTTQRRIWRLTKHADGRYTGTADDVVGRPTGNAWQRLSLDLHAGLARGWQGLQRGVGRLDVPH